MHATLPLLKHTDFPAITRGTLTTLQVNLGYRCNQSCLHCHVNAGPTRKEAMSGDVLGVVRQFLATGRVTTLDITGGAPELHPEFRALVSDARGLGLTVIDRCNLTVLDEPGQEDTAAFLADHDVEITASLPCYLEENVDAQRGSGVFEKSLHVLKRLNTLGYGHAGSGRMLNLVYNPQGPVLPPPQTALETDYKRALNERYGIVFNRLYTLANMPIQRFGSTLVSKGTFNDYLHLLRAAYRADNLAGVMCRSLISVDWRGYLYDCDFNQMLSIPLTTPGRPRTHISDLIALNVDGLPIAVAEHCYGCTAGQGSSCGGALDG